MGSSLNILSGVLFERLNLQERVPCISVVKCTVGIPIVVRTQPV